MASSAERLVTLIQKNESAILKDWINLQTKAVSARPDLLRQSDLVEESRTFLSLLVGAVAGGNLEVASPAYADVRTMLETLSTSRAKAGFSPAETAGFVFSLKEPVFAAIRQAAGADVKAVADDTWTATLLLDHLGLYTTTVYQKSREEIILRQQSELLELSTPVVELWRGVLALPLIGTLDSNRTQVVMETLLQEIVRTGAAIAIIDITGVPTVDTLVAQHLLKTVAAARLMGADCIISGMRAQIAQTIVHLGVDLNDVVTKASLSDAFAIALRRNGLTVSKIKAAPAAPVADHRAQQRAEG